MRLTVKMVFFVVFYNETLFLPSILDQHLKFFTKIKNKGTYFAVENFNTRYTGVYRIF